MQRAVPRHRSLITLRDRRQVMRFKSSVLCFILGLTALSGLGFSSTALSATYYVRPDGGTAAQCNGTVDAPASAAPNCAWASPAVALPMGDGQYGYAIPAALIKSGDTLVIESGSYMIGYSSTPVAGTQGQACNQDNTYECEITNIPSGIDATHPTVITGDCSSPPELWGTQRNGSIFYLSGQHDVEIDCLELTDHSNCITYYPDAAYACNRSTYPYGTWADTGIHADHVTNLTLQHLNIHGFADQGINAGALSGNTVLNDVTIRGNGWAGYNGDLGGNNASSSDSGTITIENSTVSWNGCTENYPSTTIFNCWGQQEGGYGDGLGESQTGGNWRIINSSFIGNTQDGLDLLYADGTGSVFVNQVTSMWNAGNQIKISGNSTVENSVVVGDCSYLQGWGAMSDADLCRASGAALSLSVTATNQTINVLYSTVAGNGDCLINGGTHGGFNSPDKTDVYNYQNNIFLGAYYYRAGRNACLDWYTDASTNPFTVNYDNNIVWAVKDNICPAGSICKDPLLTNEDETAFNATPLVSSPAVGNADSSATWVPFDYYMAPRPSKGATIGAVQYRGQAYIGSGGSDSPVPPTTITVAAKQVTVAKDAAVPMIPSDEVQEAGTSRQSIRPLRLVMWRELNSENDYVQPTKDGTRHLAFMARPVASSRLEVGSVIAASTPNTVVATKTTVESEESQPQPVVTTKEPTKQTVATIAARTASSSAGAEESYLLWVRDWLSAAYSAWLKL